MINRARLSFSFLCSASALVILMGALTACGQERSARGFETAEMTLSPQERALNPVAAGGDAKTADATAAIDPVQAHINARKRVNISPNAPSAGYHVSADDPAGRRDPANFRNLKLDPQRAADTQTASYIPPRIPSRRPDATPSEDQRIAEAAPAGGLYIAPHPKPPVPESVSASARAPNETLSTPASPATLMQNNVLAVRTGNHPGNKVRIVLDVSGPARFESAIAPGGTALDIILPGTGWAAPAAQELSNPRVSGYSAEALPDGSGTRISLALARPSRLVKSMALPPNETFGHRLVFDIAPQ